nr:hypothetical protein DA06_03005 [Georgenia sp. SUBG003]
MPSWISPSPLKQISMVFGVSSSRASGPNGGLEDERDPLGLARHPLAGPQQERHTAPALGVHPQTHGGVGVLPGVGRRTVDVPVALELPEHHVLGRVERAEGAQHRLPGVEHGRGVAQVGRRFHGHLAGDLEQVGHDHVERGTGGLVEADAVGDVEVLRHVDLDLLDARAGPLRTEELVGETQDVDGLHALLAEEVVDPEHLFLPQDLLHRGVQVLERLERRAVRLLEDDPCAVGQPVRSEPPGDGLEGDGRDRQEVQDQRLAAALVRQLAAHLVQHAGQDARVVDAELAGGVADPGAHSLPVGGPADVAVVQRPLDPVTEGLLVEILGGTADQAPVVGHEAARVHLVDRRQHHAPGQVPRGAEEDDDDGVRQRLGAGGSGHGDNVRGTP